ncbi:MAG: glycosyltransferase [Lachnospiraceae bacterium]|nr:glycosyltransferase [Lachnospiraceae bacterium]
MNILLYTWLGSYTDDDIERHMRGMGFNCRRVNDPEVCKGDRYHNDEFCRSFEKLLDDADFDCVFTTNFLPLIARVCYKKNIPYIAWSYDSPPNLASLEEMDHPTNHIFFFSKDDVEDYRSQGLDTVWHMPLAVDTDKWDAVKVECRNKDISLVGRLYSSTLPVLMSRMTEEQQQFFKTLTDLQLKTYDRNILKEFITDGIAQEISNTYEADGDLVLRPTRKQLLYAASTYVTHLDRLLLLRVLSKQFDTHLYTTDPEADYKSMLPDVKFHGPVSYEKGMPEVFKSSKVNLCPIFRENVSGIPLRILDVCGCHAFVLSSFCPEVAENFEEGKEAVMYRSAEEALEKVRYYLSHDDERERISHGGYERVKADFSYDDRISRMLKQAGVLKI